MSNTIVLTGSTGGIGRVALQTILDRNLGPVSNLRISAYNSNAVPSSVKASGIEIRQGNLYDGASLERSYAGADALFLVSFPSMGEERFALHKNAIDAAKVVGVRHVIYTSLSFRGGDDGSTSVAQVAQAHLRTEAYLKQSGLTFTILRMGTYAHLWNNYAGFLDISGGSAAAPLEAVMPDDGPAHWANREDLGEATGLIIANWEKYINKVVTLTGPELLSGADIVQKFTEHTGREVRVRVLPPKEAIEWHIKNGSLPAEQHGFLDNWASWHRANSLGELAYVDSALEEILGRKPKTINEQADEIFGALNGLDTKDLVGI